MSDSERALDEAIAAQSDAWARARAAQVARETTAHLRASEAPSRVTAPTWGWAGTGIVIVRSRRGRI